MISENALTYLKPACEYGQVYSIAELNDIVSEGTGIIWERDDAAAMTVVEEHFIDGKLQDVLVIVLAGGSMETLKSIEKETEAYAIQKKYPRLYINGRKGWGRVLDGYKEHTVVHCKDLTNG